MLILDSGMSSAIMQETYRRQVGQIEMAWSLELVTRSIDTSDSPGMTDEQWTSARLGGFYRPLKQQITARVDADVLDWLKAQGKGYQSRINAILRREMLQASKQR